MEGMALMLSAICLNTTFCPTQNAQPNVNLNEFLPRDTHKTSKAIEDELKKLAMELKGQTLTVTTLEDYPLSYTETVNGTLIGNGWAFEFFEFLMKKFDFKYTLIKPQANIVGGSNDSEGSLMQLIMKKVSTSKFI